MSTTPLPDIPSLNDTYGAVLLGLVAASTLFGFSTVQAFIYLRTHTQTSDLKLWKLSIYGLWFLDALHLALITIMVYHYLITEYLDPIELLQITWSFKANEVVSILMIYSIHVLYTYRLWIMSRGRNCTLPMVVSILVIPTVTATSIILCWAIFRSDLWSDVLNIQWAITLTLANMAAVDIILAASFCYLLSSARTGFGPSDTLVVKIMAFTFDTGLLTSICSLSVLLACVLMSSNLVYVGIDLVVTKLYINSFLAM
ncbi:hypothetical protein CONPUDRAFT_163422, partial [Coniophora puteana RWD-64-598 SS2]